MDRKLWRENRNENFFGVCLVEQGGRKINSGVQVISPWAHQNVLSKMERKLSGDEFSLD